MAGELPSPVAVQTDVCGWTSSQKGVVLDGFRVHKWTSPWPLSHVAPAFQRDQTVIEGVCVVVPAPRQPHVQETVPPSPILWEGRTSLTLLWSAVGGTGGADSFLLTP